MQLCKLLVRVSYLCIFAGVAAWHHDSVTVMQYNNRPDPPVAAFIILFLLADLHICGMFPWRMWWKEKDTDKYYNRTLRTHSTYLEIWLTRTPPRTRRKQSPGNDMKFLKRPPAMSAVSILSSVLFIFYMCNLSTLTLSHLLQHIKTIYIQSSRVIPNSIFIPTLRSYLRWKGPPAPGPPTQLLDFHNF